VKITAFDIVRMTHEVERISASKIPEAQKIEILTELKNAVPDPIFCGTAVATRKYVIETIEGAIDGCAKKTKSQIPAEEGTGTSPAQSAEEELLHNIDGNRRRQGFETPVVTKTPQKRRAAKRSS